MRTLGEEIAVLDGLDDLGTLDGQSGYQSRINVIDPTEGANYTGGSDWTAGMPLVTSNAGLADADLAAFSVQTNVPRPAGLQRPRFNVIDPSEGADYTGGSNWTAGMPLVLSNAGLAGVAAGTLVQMSAKELQDLLASAGVSIASDGVWTSSDSKSVYDFAVRTGSKPPAAQGVVNNIRPYAKGKMVVVDSELLYKVMQAVPRSTASMAGLADSDLAAFSVQTNVPRPAGLQRPRFNVIDPSEGADYTGGSNWTAGMPLVLSNAGLAADNYADGTYDGMPLSADFDEHYGSTMDTLEGNFNSTEGYTTRQNVLDPTEGANYTGGSDWTPGMPLVMSNAGLAALDAVPDSVFKALSKRVAPGGSVPGIMRVAGQNPLRQARRMVDAAVSSLTRPGISAAQRSTLRAQLDATLSTLSKIRMARGNLIKNASPTIAANVMRAASKMAYPMRHPRNRFPTAYGRPFAGR